VGIRHDWVSFTFACLKLKKEEGGPRFGEQGAAKKVKYDYLEGKKGGELQEDAFSFW